MYGSIFGESLLESPRNTGTDNSEHNEIDQQVQAHHSAVERVIENYLDPQLLVASKVDPLQWWAVHRFQFPGSSCSMEMAICAC